MLNGAGSALAGATALSASLTPASTGRAPFFTNLNQDGGELVISYWRDPWISDVVPIFEEESGITVTNMGIYSSYIRAGVTSLETVNLLRTPFGTVRYRQICQSRQCRLSRAPTGRSRVVASRGGSR